MRRRSLFPALVLFVALLLTSLQARAESPTGTWRSTSGITVTIPLMESGSRFDVIITGVNGAKGVYPAAWVNGMEGTQFTYSGNTCTFNGNDPDRIRAQSPRGETFWTRIKSPQFGWQGILGTWHSESGSSFTVADRGRVFDIIAKYGAQVQVIQGQWIPGMEGTQFQFVYGNVRYVATRNQREPNRIRVEGPNAKAFLWTR